MDLPLAWFSKSLLSKPFPNHTENDNKFGIEISICLKFLPVAKMSLQRSYRGKMRNDDWKMLKWLQSADRGSGWAY
jgi:hypothetical protein